MNKFLGSLKKALFFTGVMLVQLISYALIVAIAVALVPLVFLLGVSTESGFIFTLGLLLIACFILCGPVVSAILVHKDATRQAKKGIDILPPVTWVLLMLIFWFPSLAAYITLRKFSKKPIRNKL